MSWIIAIVVISLVMAVLTIIELWQPVKANVLRMPDQIFAAVTFSIILFTGLSWLPPKFCSDAHPGWDACFHPCTHCQPIVVWD